MEQLVRLHDAPAPALDLQPDPRTGNLRIRYPLTWVGVREYDGAPFGREGRVRIAALRAMPAAIGHPQRVDDAGRFSTRTAHPSTRSPPFLYTAQGLPAVAPGRTFTGP